MDLDTTYTEVLTDQDVEHSDAYKVSVPERGTVEIYIESECEHYFRSTYSGGWTRSAYCFYKVSNPDTPYFKVDGGDFTYKYSTARGVYLGSYSTVLPKGSYYFVMQCDTPTYGGKSYEVTLKYAPAISAPTIKTPTSGKAKIKVSWGKVNLADGYIVQYATNKKFTKAKSITVGNKNTVNKTISKLGSKKTFYVRVRSFKKMTVSGVKHTYTSKWSATKKVKTK